MPGHSLVLDELVEWFDDVAGAHGRDSLGSHCVVVPVGPGWGRTRLFAALALHVDSRSDIVGVSGWVEGNDAPDGLAVQTVWLATALRDSLASNLVRRTFEIDSAHGVFDRTLGAADVAGLLGGRVGSIAALLVSLGVDAWAGRDARDDARQLAEVDRLGRRLARFSKQTAPVALLIDDSEQLDARLLDRLVTSVVTLLDSRVLVLVACNPAHPNVEALLRRGRIGAVAERIHRLEVDATMDDDRRYDLVRSMVPDWPAAAADRLAERSASFGEVFAVLASGGAADVATSADPIAAVDRLVDAVIPPATPSRPALLVAWTGGLLHRRAYDHLVADPADPDTLPPDVHRSAQLVRLADPPSRARLADQAAATMSGPDRDRIAEILLDTAVALVDTVDDPLEQIALLHPLWVLVHHNVLIVDDTVARLLSVLATTRDHLGDREEARRLAERLAAARLEQAAPVDSALLSLLDRAGSHQLIDLPAESIVGTEARVQHTAALLRTDPAAGMAALDAVRAELDALAPIGISAEWRLLLAYRLVRSDRPAAAAKLLAPLLAATHPQRSQAELVLYSAQPGGELVLQRQAFLQRFAELPEGAPPEDRLPILDVIADLSHRLGDWPTALDYGTELLELQVADVGADHPDVLATRSYVAYWTGGCGHSAEALRLFRELLSDQNRVLGADHPDVLTTRNNIAYWTGRCGDLGEALRLYRELLPDQRRVLGADHPDVLILRNNLASLTGRCGDAGGSLRLLHELLPDQRRVLGADHPDVLTTRNNLANLTGRCGEAGEALRLYRELLPDRIRVLGADHPDVLATRNNLASLTGRCGDVGEALRLLRELLPDQRRIQGVDHPHVLATRNNLASLTGRCGDVGEALRLSRELLPDRIRVLGADHPDVLATRHNVAYWTGRSGDVGEALRLFRELLLDQIRVLGADHPDVLDTRRALTACQLGPATPNPEVRASNSNPHLPSPRIP